MVFEHYGFQRDINRKHRCGTKRGHVFPEGVAYAQVGVKPGTKRNGWYVTFGLTEEWQEILDVLETEDEKKERSEREHRAFHITVSDGAEDANGDFIPSKFDKIAYKTFQQGAATADDWVVMIEETIDKLQPEQPELVWRVFGEKKKRAILQENAACPVLLFRRRSAESRRGVIKCAGRFAVCDFGAGVYTD